MNEGIRWECSDAEPLHLGFLLFKLSDRNFLVKFTCELHLGN